MGVLLIDGVNRNCTIASWGATRYSDEMLAFLRVVFIVLMINVNEVYFLETLGFYTHFER